MGTDAEMSMSRGASFPAGAATPMGLAPSRGSAPKVGRTPTPPLEAVMHTPTMSCRAASMAKCPTAPRWPQLDTLTIPVPNRLAFSIAISMRLRPMEIPRARSASMVAVACASRMTRQSGLRIEGAVAELLHVAAQHVDAVALYAAQVGGDQHVGCISGVVIGKAKLPQYGRGGCPEGSGRYTYTVGGQLSSLRRSALRCPGSGR